MMKKLYNKIRNKLRKEILRFKIKISKFEYGLSKEKRDIPIIVSLTTFPARFDYMDLCLKSILLQTEKPDKIIVWLGSDATEEEIDLKLSKYEKYGIEFIHDKENNYKSHKKYIYAFEKYPKAVIITLDDDIIYPKDVISSLLCKHHQYPDAIIARRVHKITWDGEKIKPYLEWNGEYRLEKEPSHMLMATTGAGTLFPPKCLPKMATDFSLIKDLALTADDVWIKFMALLNNTKVVWVENKMPLPPSILESQHIALQKVNVGENMNDIYVEKIMKKFNLQKKDFEN